MPQPRQYYAETGYLYACDAIAQNLVWEPEKMDWQFFNDQNPAGWENPKMVGEFW